MCLGWFLGKSCRRRSICEGILDEGRRTSGEGERCRGGGEDGEVKSVTSLSQNCAKPSLFLA